MNDSLKIWHSPDGKYSLYVSCTQRKKSLFTDQSDSIAHLPRKQSVMITSVTFPQMEFTTQNTTEEKLVSKYQNAATHFSNFSEMLIPLKRMLVANIKNMDFIIYLTDISYFITCGVYEDNRPSPCLVCLIF